MKILIREQKLPLSIEKAWEFFSNPFNLQIITPPYMDFEITSPYLEKKIYSGMIISYRVKPLAGIPLRWLTEITQVREPYFFVDNQKAGPFRIWHHQHFFLPHGSGILMKDIVHYEVGMAWLGRLVENIMIQRRVEEIFNYRYEKLELLFKGNNEFTE